MPRDASGNYTLPVGNPVVTGTLIDSDWANSTLSDLAGQMTESLSRQGEGGMLAALKLVDGLVGAPSLTFTGEINSGVYRAGAGDVRVSIASNAVLQFTADEVRAFEPFVVRSGGASLQTTVGYGTIQSRNGSADPIDAQTLTLNPEGGEVQAWNEDQGAPFRVLTEPDLSALSSLYVPLDGSQDMTGILTIEDLAGGKHFQAGRFVVSSSESGGASIGLRMQSSTNTYYGGLEMNLTSLSLYQSPAFPAARITMRYSAIEVRSDDFLIELPSASGGDILVQTVGTAAGSLFVNNQSTGVGLERVLTQSDLPNFIIDNYLTLSSDFVVNNDTGEDVTGWDMNFPEAGTYLIKMVAFVDDSAANSGFRIFPVGSTDVELYTANQFFQDPSTAQNGKLIPFSGAGGGGNIFPYSTDVTGAVVEACMVVTDSKTVPISFGQGTATVGDTILKKTSYVKWRKLV